MGGKHRHSAHCLEIYRDMLDHKADILDVSQFYEYNFLSNFVQYLNKNTSFCEVPDTDKGILVLVLCLLWAWFIDYSAD
jgi:hypothetical protein